MAAPENFIVVDDDRTNNILCNAVIKKTFQLSNIVLFQCPEKSLEFIMKEFGDQSIKKPTVLFLDVNMGTMTGWEFLDIFKNFPPEVRAQIKIFILSSSINKSDIQKAAENELVSDYIIKPLKRDSLRMLFNERE